MAHEWSNISLSPVTLFVLTLNTSEQRRRQYVYIANSYHRKMSNLHKQIYFEAHTCTHRHSLQAAKQVTHNDISILYVLPSLPIGFLLCLHGWWVLISLVYYLDGQIVSGQKDNIGKYMHPV